MRWLDGTTDPMDLSLSKLWERSLECSRLWGHKELDSMKTTLRFQVGIREWLNLAKTMRVQKKTNI